MLDIRVVSGCGSPGSIRCTAPQLHTWHLNEVKIFRGTRKTQCSKLPTRCLREIRCSLCNSPRSSSVQDMFEFGKRLIFLLCSQSNFKIQVQKNCRDNSMKYQGSHVNNLCQNRSGDISFEESWLYISVALGFLHTISMSDPVCCSARSHCSSIRRVVSWSKSQRCAIYVKLWNMDSDIDQFCLAFSRISFWKKRTSLWSHVCDSFLVAVLWCCGVF